MKHVVELATSSFIHQVHNATTTRSVVDVGTDHGMLALGLAVSKQFEQVTGIDSSSKALENGALRLRKELFSAMDQDYSRVVDSVDFRCGDGLWPLQPGEADVVCIAGMGVATMIEILGAELQPSERLLDELGTQHLVLQPTNSRPRNLAKLYSTLFDIGWSPVEERMDFLSTRWYLSTRFHRNHIAHNEYLVPCTLLQQHAPPNTDMHNHLLTYIHHHRKWLERDLAIAGSIRDSETRWLAQFEHMGLANFDL